MIGFDIDGVLREFPLKHDTETEWYTHMLDAPVKIHPKTKTSEDYVLITGVKKTDEVDVVILKHWLKEHDIKPKEIYYLKGKRSRESLIKHKASKINELGLTEFYEDDERIYKKLVTLCPSCRIIYIPSNYK